MSIWPSAWVAARKYVAAATSACGAGRRPAGRRLHRLVRKHYATFVAHTESTHSAPLQRYVKDAFERYLS